MCFYFRPLLCIKMFNILVVFCNSQQKFNLNVVSFSPTSQHFCQKNNIQYTFLVKSLVKKICVVFWEKLGIMLVLKLSSQISLCSPHRLIRDNNFRFYGIFCWNDVSSWRKSTLGEKVLSRISLCGLHRLIWNDTLRTCIVPSFLRTRHIYQNNAYAKT